MKKYHESVMKVNVYMKYRGDNLNSIQIRGEFCFIYGSNSTVGKGMREQEQVEFKRGRNGEKIKKMTFPAFISLS